MRLPVGGYSYATSRHKRDSAAPDETVSHHAVVDAQRVDDMLGMVDNSISDYPVEARDLLPYTYPPSDKLRALKGRSVLLGSYSPWDVKEQVAIIKRELD
jgi:hypothetical protein